MLTREVTFIARYAMGFRGYHYGGPAKAAAKRPAMVGLIAVLGVLASMLLIGLEIALIWIRFGRGYPLSAQIPDLILTVVVGLMLLRFYWGVWDMYMGAWQAHIFFGPVVLLGLLYLFWSAPDLAPRVAHHLKVAEIDQAAMVLRAAAGGL